MRVITGTARGRVLKELEGLETRPTTGKVKESLFSIIQFDIEGRRVLDLFAGTGQLGIEALSRGAAECVFIDRRADAVKLIQENLASDNLRKRDAKPVEEVRLDGITERLEKAGLMRNGKPVDPDTAFELLFHRRPKYSYTKDAAEQMLLAIINTSRINDSLPELSTLPDSARIKDDLHEFAEEPNELEKTAYEGFGYLNMPPAKE